MSVANVDNAIRSIMGLVRNTFASALQSFLAGTSALPLANGGTGGTDAATALAALGALPVAYRDLPGGNDQSAAFTFADAMRGGGVTYNGAAAVATLNPYATTPIGVRGVICIRVIGSGALTITPGAGVTLRKNGATGSSTATLAIGAVATLIQWTQDEWSITGSGIS